MNPKKNRIWYQSYVNSDIAETYLKRLRQYLTSISDRDTEIVVHEMTPPDSLAHPVMELRCSRQVITNAIRAEREGYDAYIVGHMQDAGLYEAKSVVGIPVMGLGEASMLYSCMLGQKIGIVTINPKYISWFQQQVRKYGLEQRVTGIHALDFEPGEITRAFDSHALYSDVISKFRQQCQPLVEAGCDIIIPGGGIPMLLFAKEENFTVNGAPVVNGLPLVTKLTETAVWLHNHNGLGVSRTSDFCQPPTDYIEEFLNTL